MKTDFRKSGERRWCDWGCIVIRCVLFLAITLFISVGAYRVAAQETSETETVEDANAPAETVSVQNISDDDAIRDRLTKIFDSAKEAGWLSDAEVDLKSGIVTIRGQADTEEHRQWAENVARKTEDVVAVINELSIDSAVDLASTREVVTKSLDSLWTDFLVRSPLLVAALFVVLVTSLLSKLASWSIHRLLDNRGMRTSLKDLVNQLSSIAIWIVGLLIATVVAFPGMTPSKALTVLGLGSVAIGFAFKDIFENFFAGILILWG